MGKETSLHLPTDANFPLSGRFRVILDREVIDGMETISNGIHGIYPGDFYGSKGRDWLKKFDNISPLYLCKNIK